MATQVELGGFELLERTLRQSYESDPEGHFKDGILADILAGHRALRGADIVVGYLASALDEEASLPKVTPVVTAPPSLNQETPLQLADLRTPNHFRDYFTDSLGRFLGQEVVVSLPSQEHVDRGQRIEDAGFTTFEPVVFPNLTIVEGFNYPPNWKFPLDPWVYQQIAEKNLKPKDLNLKELWGWLDTSVRLDWKSGDPMYDPNMDVSLAEVLVKLREKGRISVPSYVRHLDSRSPFGASADETKNAVYPALAKTFGAKRGEVRDLTAAEFNFIGNWLYPHFGEARSWELLNNPFEVGYQLIGGYSGDGGLSRVSNDPSGDRDDSIRFRPLAVSPSRA